MRHCFLRIGKMGAAVLAVIIFLSSGCSSVSQIKINQLVFGGQNLTPKYPTLFLPGLSYTGTYWSRSKMFRQLRKFGWTYGGDIKAHLDEGQIHLETDKIVAANNYTVSFSTTESAIVEQGRELARVIEFVKKLNGAPKVNLVGHSMGGLAAREYLQSENYSHDVNIYISVGTPHQGSDYRLKKWYLRMLPMKLQTLISRVDIRSDAVRDLGTKSIYLWGGNEASGSNDFFSKDVDLNGKTGDEIVGLNNFSKRPLPQDVRYVVVVGAGDFRLGSTRKQNQTSDGLVEIMSQDLNAVPGVNVKALPVLSKSSHLAQSDDVWVYLQTLRLLTYTNPES